MCATLSVHLITWYNPINIWLWLRNSLHSPGTTCPLDQNFPPNLCSHIDLRDQVLGLFKTTRSIMPLYILIITSWDCTREDKKLSTEGQQGFLGESLFPISSWMQMWFVSPVPQYYWHIGCFCYTMLWFCTAFLRPIISLGARADRGTSSLPPSEQETKFHTLKQEINF
jgi:hypothetical protein